MHLIELLRAYGRQRDVSIDTVRWITGILSRFERHLRRKAAASDLTDDAVNDWVSQMLADGALSRSTVHGYRRGLLILWRFAVEQGVVNSPPARLRRVKVPPSLPVAWSQDQIAKLAAAAASLKGNLKTGLPRRSVAFALVLIAWDSGLRLADLLQLRFADIDKAGAGAVVQHKTGNPVLFQLSPAAMAALDSIRLPKREFIFGTIASRKAVYLAMRMACSDAGLNGGTRKIRKSGATAVEQELPGSAMGYLGHRTPGLAHRHYLDPRLIQSSRKSPPPISLKKKPPKTA